MKSKFVYSIFLILVLLGLHQHIQAQDTSEPRDSIQETIDGKLYLKVKPYADKLVLRWGIDNSAAWLAIRETGVHIERVILDEHNQPLFSKGWERITSEPVKPWDESTFKAKGLSDTTNDALLLVGQTLFGGSSVQTDGIEDLPALEDASMEFENNFLLAFLGADMDTTAATALGVRYVDKSPVNNSYKYAYKIYPAQILPPVFQIDTAFFITHGKLKDEKYSPRYVQVKGEDEYVRIILPKDQLYNIYTSYYFERSEDGKNFVQLHKKPIIFNQLDSSLTYIFIDSIPNYKAYYYRVRGKDAFGDFSEYSPIVSGMATNQTAPPVGQLFASTNGIQVKLNWSQSTYRDRPIAGYIIRRGKQRSDLNEYLTEKLLPPTQTEFTDTPPSLTSGVFYQVLSVDTSGNYSGTNIQYVFAYDSIPPSVPTGLRAQVDSIGKVVLSWNMDYSDYIQGYRVFVSNVRNADFSPLNSDLVRDTVFVDSLDASVLNKEVYYRIVAVDGNNNHSDFSEILTVKRPKMVKDPAPVIGSYEVKSKMVQFSWDVPSNIDIKEIRILRKPQKDSTWMTIAYLPLESREYKDESVEESQVYEYAVATCDFEGRLSNISYPLSVFVYASNKPAPENLVIKNKGETKMLTWNHPGKAKVSYYILYKDTGEGLEQFDSVEGNITEYILGKDTGQRYGIRAVYNDSTKSTLVRF